MKDLSSERLWRLAPPATDSFDPTRLSGLPEPARRYLEHSVRPGTPLATAVRLRMHGEIKLKRWYPFSAQETVLWGRGMVWRANVRVHGIPILGADRLLDAEAAMRWRLLGLIPVVGAEGPDIAKSMAGRVNVESLWLPSVLCRGDVVWNQAGESSARATFTAHGEISEILLAIDPAGGLLSTSLLRWGNPDGGAFRYAPFGALVAREASFGGFTIPAELRVGWLSAGGALDGQGEFFRVTIDQADYR